MKLYRRFDNVYVEIELTPNELYRAYEEQRRRFFAQDIAQNIEDRIEDADDPDYYAVDWSMRVGEHAASDLVEKLDSNERFGEVFRDMVDLVVEAQLEELGIDPETMKKEEEE